MRRTAVLGVLQGMVDELADRLMRSVVVDDPDVVLVCASRHFGDEDAVRVRAVLQRAADPAVARFVLAQHPASWPGPRMLAGSDELGLQPRLCVPLREQGLLLGLLMVIDADHTLRPDELALVEEAAERMSTQLYADQLAEDTELAQREELLRALVDPQATGHGEAAAALVRRGDLRDGGSVVVTVLELRDRDGRRLPAVGLGRVLAGAVSATPGEAAVLADRRRPVVVELHAVAPGPAAQRERAARLVDLVQRRLGDGVSVRVGVGGTVSGLPSAWRSARQASSALRAAGRVPALQDVGVWQDLGEYAVLAQVDPADLVDAAVFDPLRRLGSRDTGGRLRETLVAFLEQGGSMPRTAEALHVHRTSLYYRLRQIEEATGVDLADGSVRFRLQLALRLDALDSGDPRGRHVDELDDLDGPEPD